MPKPALRFTADAAVVGFWEYEPEAKEVGWTGFDKVKPAAKKRIAAEAEETARFIRDEIGHGKSFSIDSDADLTKRAGMVRKLGT